MTTTTINLIKYKRQQSYGTKYTNAAGFESNFFLGVKSLFLGNRLKWNKTSIFSKEWIVKNSFFILFFFSHFCVAFVFICSCCCCCWWWCINCCSNIIFSRNQCYQVESILACLNMSIANGIFFVFVFTRCLFDSYTQMSLFW